MSIGSRIHETAVIGSPPEQRDWTSGCEMVPPMVGLHVRISAYVTVDAGRERATVIGDRSFLMAGCHVGHDALIGAGCEIAPKAVIGGFAVLEDYVRVGIGAMILPRKTIGRGARIGAGAVVTKDVPAGEVWVGNPSRPLYRATGERLTPLEEEGWEQFAEASPFDGYADYADWFDRRGRTA